MLRSGNKIILAAHLGPEVGGRFDAPLVQPLVFRAAAGQHRGAPHIRLRTPASQDQLRNGHNSTCIYQTRLSFRLLARVQNVTHLHRRGRGCGVHDHGCDIVRLRLHRPCTSEKALCVFKPVRNRWRHIAMICAKIIICRTARARAAHAAHL